MNPDFSIQVGREPSDERTETLLLLEKIVKESESLKKELQKYRDSDPEYISQLKTEIQVPSQLI